jgi:hypothetical protein
MINEIIAQFKLYQHSHPNLTRCWLHYLELKKRHYDANSLGTTSLGEQCAPVLNSLAAGFADLTHADIIRLIVYKHVLA